MDLLVIFLVFAKLGLISFGGGYAMIPFLQYEVVTRGWLTQPEIMDIIGMSQITPGPVATNMATFVGFSEHGFVGALVTTIGVTLPSVILVIVVTKFIMKKINKDTRDNVFSGLQPVVIGLILCSVISLADEIVIPSGLQSFDIKAVIISLVSLFLLVKYKVNPIKLIIGAALVGIIVF